MTVFFDNRQDHPLPDGVEALLIPAVDSALAAAGFSDSYEVSLSFVTKEEIRALNASYRNKDAVTDVLSFPAELEFSLPVQPLGDIILCPERAEEQAMEIGNRLEQELVYLTIHSVLHLLGYDHMDENDKAAMREKEKIALSEVKHGQKETDAGI